MAFTPTVGSVAVLKLQLAGATAAVSTPGMNWKFDMDGKTKDVSNFRDGRVRVGTLGDSTITMQIPHDQAAPSYLAGSASGYSLTLGATGTANLYVSATNFYSVGVIVAKIGDNNEGVEGVVLRDVTFEQSGTLTNPTGG